MPSVLGFYTPNRGAKIRCFRDMAKKIGTKKFNYFVTKFLHIFLWRVVKNTLTLQFADLKN